MKAIAGVVIIFITSFATAAFVAQLSSFTKSPSFFSSKGQHQHYQNTIIKMADQQPATSADKSYAAKAIDFLTLTRSLKTTKRTGWVLKVRVCTSFI
jgi:hypothetical protein